MIGLFIYEMDSKDQSIGRFDSLHPLIAFAKRPLASSIG